jgi:glycosyltransferase involved in cell wall biosynthesis
VAEWLAASNLLCLASHSEGVPNIAIEALSCGRPVVGTRVGGIPEIVDANCGILVPAKEPQRLADALVAGLQTAWDENTIASACRRSWHDTARETHDALLQVLEKKALEKVSGEHSRVAVSHVSRD